MKHSISTLPLNKTTVTDAFWQQRMENVRTKMIPYQWQALNDNIPGAEPSYCIRNFKLAAKVVAKGKASLGADDTHKGFVFQDSDVYKWLEAVAYSLAWHPDKELESLADSTIDLIASAQMPDGYLDTLYILGNIDERFTNLKDNHELYCLGHMVESAVAYYTVTGKDKFLKVAQRFIDCVKEHIGKEEGKIHGYPGHPILEMALIRLYDVTHKDVDLELAKYFIDMRGQQPLFFEEEDKKNQNKNWWKDSYLGYQYYQAGMPLRQQKVAQGHAVRALYLYAGMADVARETDDEELLAACRALYKNITTRQMYITGNVGQCAYGESFSLDYDLPNDLVYGETCAQIALVFLSQRLLKFGLDGHIADIMERVLYNGVLSGASLDGQSFFYVNPLEVVPELTKKAQPYTHVKAERQKWFGCACCPPNFARLVSSIGTYIHTLDTDTDAPTIATHLFIASKADFIIGSTAVTVELSGGWPWEGNINVTFHCKKPVDFTYAIRKPDYVSSYTIKINGKETRPKVKDGYFLFERKFTEGDSISYQMDLPVRLIHANPRVREDVGKVAVMRGPIVYCLEEADNGKDLHLLHLTQEPKFGVTFEAQMLGGVTVLMCTGKRIDTSAWNADELYRDNATLPEKDTPLIWIPYFAWDNRRTGEMRVWIRS